MNRQDKELTVKEVHEGFKNATAAYITRYAGLKSITFDELRRKVRKSGGHFQVIKNTLARLGAKGTQFEKLAQETTGAAGWAYTVDDPVALAKVLKEFRKENEVFVYERGVLEGQILDAKGIDAVSEMPSKTVILAQLLGMLNSPARSLATVIQAVPRQLVTVLDAIRRKKEEESKNV